MVTNSFLITLAGFVILDQRKEVVSQRTLRGFKKKKRKVTLKYEVSMMLKIIWDSNIQASPAVTDKKV
jgi:hypothetical protein